MDWESTAIMLKNFGAVVRQRRDGNSLGQRFASSTAPSSSFIEIHQIEATDNLRVNRIRPLIAAAVCIEESKADVAIKNQV